MDHSKSSVQQTKQKQNKKSLTGQTWNNEHVKCSFNKDTYLLIQFTPYNFQYAFGFMCWWAHTSEQTNQRWKSFEQYFKWFFFLFFSYSSFVQIISKNISSCEEKSTCSRTQVHLHKNHMRKSLSWEKKTTVRLLWHKSACVCKRSLIFPSLREQRINYFIITLYSLSQSLECASW